MAETKPSFIRSVWEGIKGYFKGILVGGAIGALIVGGIGLVAGFFAPGAAASVATSLFGAGSSIVTALGGAGSAIVAASPEAAVATLMPPLGSVAVVNAIVPTITHTAGAALAGISGAAIGGGLFAGLGALTGAVTGVVRSRESDANMVRADQAMEAVKVAVVQGMAIEHQRAAMQEATGTKWQDLEKQRAQATTLAQNQVH